MVGVDDEIGVIGVITLPGVELSVAHARRFTRALLGRDHPSLGDIELCVSEAVTNGGAPRGALSYPRRSREELKGGFWV
jgi:hypothetical protein